MNEITANTRLQGETYAQGQIQAALAIAHQCPYSGGNAVFAARALYALADKNKFYNDFTLCGNANVELRKAETKTETRQRFAVRPNPANDKATLDYDLTGDDAGLFEIYSATGQPLMLQTLDGKNNQYTFSTAQLPPAVYYYIVKTNNGIRANGKLVIIR